MTKNTNTDNKPKGFNVFNQAQQAEVNSNINNDVKFNEIPDPLEKLQNELPAKELTTKLVGIYFDNEVVEVINAQAEKLGRGGKSRLVNDIVKNYFVSKGLL